MTDLADTLARLYRSEINVSIVSFWDGGFDVRLGDELNGYVAEGSFDVDELADVPAWLDAQAVEHYPESTYARSRAFR